MELGSKNLVTHSIDARDSHPPSYVNLQDVFHLPYMQAKVMKQGVIQHSSSPCCSVSQKERWKPPVLRLL